MKIKLFIFLSLVCQITMAQENYIDLVWSDEFNVDGAPDPANWGYDLGSHGWGNNELQNYTSNSQNARVENGNLIITAIKNGGQWTSARLKSQGKKNFTYGRIVWRAKLPAGSGTWGALWTLGESVSTIGWPACGEIDVMEYVGKWPNEILSAIHTSSSFGNTVNKNTTQSTNVSTQWHTYELLWTPEKLAFYVDGNVHYTYNPSTKNASTWPFTAPQFLIMNIAMGGNLGSDPQYETGGMRNGVDPALTQAKMEVDYVRVYQPFTTLKLEGPNVVQRNQTGVTFKTNSLEGATYEWIVPAGAVIASGQGSSEISVNWGTTEGNVKVIVTYAGVTHEKEIVVTQVTKPQGAVFPLRSSEFGIQWADADDVNQYLISNGEELRIDYTVTWPSGSPSLVGTFARPLDLTDHSVLHIRAKSFNKSNSLLLRADLVDHAGRSTNKSPVFNFTPLIDDGEYYDYRFDFGTVNQWQNSLGAVNPSEIAKINLYVDFGAFGSAASDSLWIELINVEQAGQSLLANRPSHLTGELDGQSITLSWQDNASDESGFRIYSASSEEGPFSLFSTVEANTTSVSFPVGGEDPFGFYFRVTGLDAGEETPPTNVFQLEETVTGLRDEFAAEVSLFPNPTKTKSVHLRLVEGVYQINVFDAKGLLVHSLRNVVNPKELNMNSLPAGIYFISISRDNQSVTRKLLLQ